MPIYTFRCDSCATEFDRVRTMASRNDPSSCPECGESSQRIVTGCNFNLPGDDWPGKALRVNKQMRARRQAVGARQRELTKDAPSVTLAPNVEGERVGSWSEARKLAKSKGKRTDTYDPLVRKEKADK